MKKFTQTLVAAVLFGAFSLAAHAQPAVKILIVDMNKLFESHYKTAEKLAQLQGDDQKAGEEIERLQKELNALVEEYKSLGEQASSPAASAEAKAKAQTEGQKKMAAIQAKQQEGQNFVQNSRNGIQQRMQTFRNVLLEELSKTASDIAKRKGATILLDKAGQTTAGISNVIYSDPAYDITDEVMKEVNKDRPASATAPATSATPSASTSAPASGSPMITVPVAPKK